MTWLLQGLTAAIAILHAMHFIMKIKIVCLTAKTSIESKHLMQSAMATDLELVYSDYTFMPQQNSKIMQCDLIVFRLSKVLSQSCHNYLDHASSGPLWVLISSMVSHLFPFSHYQMVVHK